MTEDQPPAARPSNAEHDPLRAGLFRALRNADWTINPEKWRKAREAGELVGQCRRRGCGGYLIADDPPPHGPGPVEFTARCLVCNAEVVAPGGRLLHRSGRHGEAADFHSRRAQILKRK